MKYTFKQYDNIGIVTLLEERLDAALTVNFKEKLKMITDDGCNHMVLNLSHVKFMDSSGLGAVVSQMKYMGAEQKIQLCSLSPTVEKVFKLTRMDTIFEIFNNIDEALSANQSVTV